MFAKKVLYSTTTKPHHNLLNWRNFGNKWIHSKNTKCCLNLRNLTLLVKTRRWKNPLPDELLELSSPSFGPALMVRGSFSAVRFAAARPVPQIFEHLFSKKIHTRKSPQGWSVVKCREFEEKIRWNELCPFHEFTVFALTLLEKVSRIRNLKENSENRETFSWRKI